MSTLDVLDLPQLYTKPSAKALLDTLALLESAPPSWDDGTTNGTAQRGTGRDSEVLRVNPEGVTSYLTGIVSSPLHWIEDEDAQEQIWTQASLRLSERSGRTAMGDISRKFRVPSAIGDFELSIHEPALTGDDLGLKTWAASYLLAKRLHTFDLIDTGAPSKLQVLELGSGTGLVGLAMASLGADVVLTDLPSIFPNLTRNARVNSGILLARDGSARCGILDWTNPKCCDIYPENLSDPDEISVSLNSKFPLILAADSLYSTEHPRWLVDTIATWLAEGDDARVIVEFPLRDAYLAEVGDFRDRMRQIGLHMIEQGEEKGYDDWGWTGAVDEDNEDALVTCWWSCWGRKAPVG